MVITRRGLFGLIAVALAPQIPLLAQDTEVKRGLVILKEELHNAPYGWGQVVRVLADIDGAQLYACASLTYGAWNDPRVRELVRAELRQQLYVFYDDMRRGDRVHLDWRTT